MGGPVAYEGQHELAATFAAIAEQLIAARDIDETLERIVGLAVEIVEGCDYAGISLLVEGRLVASARDDEIAKVLGQIQNDTGEGPCVAAVFDEYDVYESADLLSEQRWPRFTAAALERTDVRSALGTVLRAGGEVLGALDLYATTADAFSDEDRGLAAIFAAHAAVALRTARQHEQLRQAVDTRDVIGQAKGIIMARTGVDENAAFALLSDASNRMRRKLRDVARNVVDRERFTQGPDASGT